MRARYYIILWIIIIFCIVIITEAFRPVQYTFFYSKRLGKLQKQLFNEYYIKNNATNWNIYLPNGYNFIEKELKNIKVSYKGYGKYIFGINGCDWIVSKNGLWILLCKEFTRDKAKNLMPESYILYDNDDKNLLKKNFRNETYIIKKNIQRKNGIKITRNLNEILNSESDNFKIAQKYIDNTFLVKNRKLNIRIYMLVIYRKFKHIYLYRDGKCIYTSKEYSNNIHDKESNITSYNMSHDIYNAYPYSLDELNHYILKNNNLNIDIWFKIKDLISLVGKACIPIITKSNNIKLATTYQLFGADILLDHDLNPYILEINKGPDMQVRCEKDRTLKYAIYEDIYSKLKIIKTNRPNKFMKIKIN